MISVTGLPPKDQVAVNPVVLNTLVRFAVLPAQMVRVESLPNDGLVPTVTVVDAVQEEPLGVVAITVYTYVPGVVGAVTPVGFCKVDVKQSGPVH